MADQVEQRLVESFCEAWGAVAPALLGRDSAAGLLDLREADGNGLDTALAVAATWSSGFVASCSGALSGAVVCLFKEEDGAEIERLTRQAVDGMPKPGGRSLVRAVLAQVAADFADRGAPALTLGEVAHLDVSEQGARLARIVGENVWMATLSVTIGDEQETQAMLLYAPQGAVAEPASMMAAQAAASAASLAQRAAARPAAVREQPDSRNLDRLLGVELEVVVCFGSTSIPLRDVVRLGTGMMIELNRAVDEPVELMVNGRLLARGEVVVVDGYYGVRITEIGAPGERPLSVILPGGLQ